MSNLRERRNVSKAACGRKELARGEVCVVSFSLSLFLSLSLCFFPLCGEGERRHLYLSRSVVLFDETATSPSMVVVDDGKRRSLYLLLLHQRKRLSLSLSFLSSAKGSPPLRSVALFDQKTTSLSEAVDEEGKRHLYRWLSSTHENGDQSLCFFPLLGETASSLFVSSQANRKMDCQRGVIKVCQTKPHACS